MRQQTVRDRMKRGKIDVRSYAFWIYAPVLLLALSALGFHFLSIQTASAAPVPQAPPAKTAEVPATDKDVKEALVIVNRTLASPDYGILNYDGHVSVRSPSNPNHFYLARWVAPAIVTAKDIIEYDMDAKPVAGDRPDQYSERYIHSEIYKARPDVNAIVHSHTPELVAFADSSVPLASFERTSGSYIKENLPIFDIRKYNEGRSGIVQTQPLGKALADVLGAHPAVLMLGHGAVITSPSIYGLIATATGLRKTAQMQEEAIALGKKLTYLDKAPGPGRAAAAGAPKPQPQTLPSDGASGGGADRAWRGWKQTVDEELAAEAKGPKPPSGDIAKTKAQMFEDLARANRLFDKWGFLDTAGHVSMRDPNNPNHYFISRWVAANSVVPSGIIEMDLDSVPVGSNRTDIYQERYIHGEIYKVRPDVNAVVHSHTKELIVYGATADTMPLRPVINGGTFIGDGLPLLNVRGLISTPALGQQLGQVLGKSGAALLVGHGAVTVAPSLYALVARLDALVSNARIQTQAVMLGGNVTYLKPQPAAASTPAAAPRATGEGGGRAWQYWVRTVSIR